MARTPHAPCLVKRDLTTKKLVLDQGTLQALREIQGPVAVVGICGGARKGKSSLLTRIMECQGGLAQSFEASAEVDPCTNGLHISTVPVAAEDSDGAPYSLLFLDTEGIDATDQERRDMCQVFALCVLLSSVVLLNEVSSISESTLDMLSLVSEVTSIVRAKAGNETPSGAPEGDALAALSSFSPKLCWVLRDFCLRLREGEGPTEYMERSLQDLPEGGLSAAATAEKNRVRGSIRALFPARDCFTLVRPHWDEDQLHDMQNMCLEDLNPKFQDKVRQLANAVCSSATPPRVQDTPLTGPLLAALCEAYVAAMNTGAVADVGSVHITALETAAIKAKDKAMQLYRAGPADPVVLAGTLARQHVWLSERALECFWEGTLGFPGETVGPVMAELQSEMEAAFKRRLAQERAASARQLAMEAGAGAVGGLAGGASAFYAAAGAAAAETFVVGTAILASPVVGVCAGVAGAVGGLYYGVKMVRAKNQRQKSGSARGAGDVDERDIKSEPGEYKELLWEEDKNWPGSMS